MPNSDEAEQLTEEVPCPFCLGKYSGADVDGQGAVCHSMPMCKEFDELNVLDFLEAARLKIEGLVH